MNLQSSKSIWIIHSLNFFQMKNSTIQLIFGIVFSTILLTHCTPTKGLLKLDNGNYLISQNFVVQKGSRINLEDANQLEALTVNGKDETTAIHKSVKNDWVNETVYDHKNSIVSDDVRIKVDNLFAKYSPKKTKGGDYIVNRNYLATDVAKITLRDAQQLENLTLRAADETTAVHKSVKDDWVNETVYDHKNSIAKPDIKIKVDKILAKYSPKKPVLGDYFITQNYLVTNSVKLATRDAIVLEDATVYGASETTTVHKSVKSGWVDETVYSHKNSIISNDARIKVDNILAKYSPQKLDNGNYSLNNNYVMQKGKKISIADIKLLQALTVTGTDKVTVVQNSFNNAFPGNHSVIKHDKSVINQQLLSKVDAVMTKYSQN